MGLQRGQAGLENKQNIKKHNGAQIVQINNIQLDLLHVIKI